VLSSVSSSRIAHEVLLDALDLVGEVGALAPDLLEAVDDVLEQLVDGVGCSREHDGSA
jgi:hypothetical protein